MFFCFDGVDGAGKSTQIDRFVAWLTELGHDVVTCREPGGTPLGEVIRELVLGVDSPPIVRRSEMLLYMASRAQLVESFIRPALAAGQTVVCDRFLLASVVYQGHAGGLEVDDIWSVGQVATGGLLPDLTFVFDLPLDVALSRMNRELDRIEQQGTDFLADVRTGFLTELKAARHPHLVRIDATPSIDDVHQQIKVAAESRLSQKDVR